jgi:hypothetical protein
VRGGDLAADGRRCWSDCIFERALSSAGERCLHTAEVTGSKPVAPTASGDTRKHRRSGTAPQRATHAARRTRTTTRPTRPAGAHGRKRRTATTRWTVQTTPNEPHATPRAHSDWAMAHSQRQPGAQTEAARGYNKAKRRPTVTSSSRSPCSSTTGTFVSGIAWTCACTGVLDIADATVRHTGSTR